MCVVHCTVSSCSVSSYTVSYCTFYTLYTVIIGFPESQVVGRMSRVGKNVILPGIKSTLEVRHFWGLGTPSAVQCSGESHWGGQVEGPIFSGDEN